MRTMDDRRSDFYEADESPEKIKAAFDRGEKRRTAEPHPLQVQGRVSVVFEDVRTTEPRSVEVPPTLSVSFA